MDQDKNGVGGLADARTAAAAGMTVGIRAAAAKAGLGLGAAARAANTSPENTPG